MEFFVKSTLQSIKRGVRFPSASPPPVRDVITVGHGELSKKVCLDERAEASLRERARA